MTSHRNKVLIGTTIFFLIVCLPGPWSSVLAAEPVKFLAVHFNDSHSHLESIPSRIKLDGATTYLDMGGFARIKTKVDQLRAGKLPVVLLEAGDLVQGTLYYTEFKGAADMVATNLLQPEAMCLGNHEFDQGPNVLVEMLKAARFPILSANVDASAVPALQALVKPYVILKIGRARAAVVGLTLQGTSVISSPGPVKFRNPAKTLKPILADLKAQGINKIIVLSHIGYDKDIELAGRVEGIDLIVGGHSHSLLNDRATEEAIGLRPQGPYPTKATGPTGEPVYVVQAWKYTQALGLLEVDFDAAGIIRSAKGQAVHLVGDVLKQKDGQGKKQVLTGSERNKAMALIAASPVVETVDQDRTVLAALEPFQKKMAALSRDVVARAAEDLIHERIPNPGSQGSQVAPIIAAAMLEKVNSVGQKAQAALVNAGGVRTDIPQGDLTVARVYEVMPFGNSLVVLEVTGAELTSAMEQGLERAVHNGGGAFLYPAGLTYTADMNRPKGKRITELRIAGRDVKSTQTYRIVIADYIARGGDGYSVFKKAAGYRCDTGFIDAPMFIEYARAKKVLTRPKTSGVKYIAAK